MNKITHTRQEIPQGKSRTRLEIEVPAGISLFELYQEIGTVPGNQFILSQNVTLVFLSEVHEWKS